MASTRVVTTLQDVNPALASEWHPTLNGLLQPNQVPGFSNSKAWWQCSTDARHIWEARISNRAKGAGCPVCANRLIIPGVNDLASDPAYRLLIQEWHPDNEMDPSQVAPMSHAKVKWQCSQNPTHVWQASIALRARGTGCPKCWALAKRGSKRRNSVTVAATERLMKEWHPDNEIDPAKTTIGSGKTALWRCSDDPSHEWRAVIGSRSKTKAGCPHCSGRIVDTKNANLANHYPTLAAELHPDNPMSPEDVYAYSILPVKWRCSKDPTHEWEAAPHSRSVVMTGCPKCLGRVRHKPVTTNERMMSLWSPDNSADPNAITLGSAYKALWRCTENPEHPQWSTMVYTIARGSGCPTCAAQKFSSKGEAEVADVVLALGFLPERNARSAVKGVKEIDIFLPELKFAIDFNGLYWHTEQFKGKSYHAEKQRACREAGVSLYEVWEDDWNTRREIVIRGLAHRLGATDRLRNVLPDIDPLCIERLNARALKVVSVDARSSQKFMDENHIQGASNGTWHLGLQDHQGVLRAVLVITWLRDKNAAQINRYATRGIVRGGFTRLLSHAEKRYTNIKKWVTFADPATSDGGLYENNGFIVDHILPVSYSYLVNAQRVHKFNYRLKRFRNDPDLIWEDNMSERQLADLNGIARIYDSGKIRYVKEVSR